MAAAAASATVEYEEVQQEEEEEETTVSIEKLMTMGINASDIKKLKEAGIVSVGFLSATPRKRLLAIKGMSETKVDKILEQAKKLNKKGQGGIFMTALDNLEERQKTIYKLSTGSKEFDDMLGGGVETKAMTEIFGEFRTGKTQFCHTLSVVSQQPREEGGGLGRVAYIDTEGTFRPERIKEIAERFNLDADAVLGNILYSHIKTTDQFEDALRFLVGAFQDEGPFRLLVVDSIIALFRTEYELNILLANLKKIGEEFNVAVVLTNQVMADPGGMTFAGADNRKAVGGHILSHAVTWRVYLKKGKGENRVAKLQCGPSMPEGECNFSLSKGGVAAAQD